MHYIFFDESKQNDGLIVPAVIVPQASYDVAIRNATFQSKSRRLIQIDEFLKKVTGLGVVCRLRFVQDWYTEKADDSYIGIPRLSRSDHVWSIAVSYAITTALIKAEQRGSVVSNVDIFHDPKCLTRENREELHKFIRERISAVVKDLIKMGRALGLKDLSIGKIESISKYSEDDNLKRGISLADQIVHGKGNDLKVAQHIETEDITKFVESTVNNQIKPIMRTKKESYSDLLGLIRQRKVSIEVHQFGPRSIFKSLRLKFACAYVGFRAVRDREFFQESYRSKIISLRLEDGRIISHPMQWEAALQDLL